MLYPALALLKCFAKVVNTVLYAKHVVGSRLNKE